MWISRGKQVGAALKEVDKHQEAGPVASHADQEGPCKEHRS